MRMFLIAMCDIFLILYLTALTTTGPKTALTVNDFFELKAMHDTLQENQLLTTEQLRLVTEQKEQLLIEKNEQQELAFNRQIDLEAERQRMDELKQTLLISDAEREEIFVNLKEREAELSQKEEQLANLNQQISVKEQEQRTKEIAYQEQLAAQRESIEQNRQLAQRLETEANAARALADQARIVQEEALRLKQEALQQKDQALVQKQQAQEQRFVAVQAMQEAEIEREQALAEMEEAKRLKAEAEKTAQQLAAAVEQMKQDGETAFQDNIQPKLELISVTYERKVANRINDYERVLTLLPITIDEEQYVVFPTKQIGFNTAKNSAPDKLVIRHGEQQIQQALMHPEYDLMAVVLPDSETNSQNPYGEDFNLSELMPALLTLRNNGNVNFFDKIRGISENYFIINRDDFILDDNGHLVYDIAGFRGTGHHGEQIVRGDQLVDLNGKFIGVANNANQIIRIKDFKDWQEMSL